VEGLKGVGAAVGVFEGSEAVWRPGKRPGRSAERGPKSLPEARNRAERREAREKVPEDTCYILTAYYLLYL
jgi:hypothetical protein